MIYDEDEEECWNYMKDQLRQNWPNFHEKQLFKLSVREVGVTFVNDLNPIKKEIERE